LEENGFMAWRDQQKLADSLLRQSLSAEAGRRDSDEACPDAQMLAAYFERSLAGEEKANFELHLSQCSICREQLATMHRANETTAVDSAPAQAHRWAWLWDWRWLAPVATALIFASIWTARRPAEAPSPKQHPLVAMSQPEPPPNTLPLQERGRDEDRPAQAAAPPAKPSRNLTGELGAKPQPSATSPAPGMANRSENGPPNPGSDKEVEKNSVTRKDEQAERGFTDAIGAPAAPKTGSVSRDSGESPAPARENGSLLSPAPHQRTTTVSEANSIGPQRATVEMKGNPPTAAPRTSLEHLQSSVQAQSAPLALQAVERRSGMRIIKTPDSAVLWRFAEGSFVERSTDDGTSWKVEVPSANAQLTAGFAPTVDVCWVVGRVGAIFLTTNARDWKRIHPPLMADFTAVTAQDASSAIVTATDGRRFATTDGGSHWNPAP
jgi:hypothetical protein